jgi:predicted membrane-bound dolichyl-phosphate-mannose-protein mannosyltransferase
MKALIPIRTWLSKVKIWHILLLSFILHLSVIPFPSNGLVFDESYYGPAAEDILYGVASNLEHPPLAKIVIALSMLIFGDNWFAWRFPIVLMAVASLYVFYLIAKRFMSERYALFATAILSFDVIFFVHGSIFVLDIPAILFGLIGIELYFAKKYSWSAFSFGISFLMKEMGLLFLLAILIYHVATHLKLQQFKNKVNLKKTATFLIVLLLISGGALWLYDIIYSPPYPLGIENGHTIILSTTNQSMTNPIENLLVMWYALRTSPAMNPGVGSQYRPPWSWVLPIGNSLNPEHYYTATGIDWVSEVTPFVEYFLLPIVAVALFIIVRKKGRDKLAILLMSWICACYIPLLLIGIIIRNWTYENFYIIYTIPALALGIPYVWSNLIKSSNLVKSEEKVKAILFIQLVSTLIWLLYFFPIPLIGR